MRISRNELSKKYNIDKNSWSRRHDDLLEHLNDYMDIEEVCENKRYYYNIKGEMPDYIPKLARKSSIIGKQKDYEDFTISALGDEYKPNSKTKVARDAIDSFGYEKYQHTSPQSVVRKYVGPIMDKKGEHSEHMVWVDCYTYEPINNELYKALMTLFKKEHLSEKEMANAFVKAQQGDDILKEASAYRRVIMAFKEEYGIIPIKVYEWKLKCGS